LAVADIKEIKWKQAALDDLHIPPRKKKAAQALPKPMSSGRRPMPLTMLSKEKGKGSAFFTVWHLVSTCVVLMLTGCISGPPGVGKTLTAELLAEHLHRALMPVSAGELGTTAEAVEERLPRIFKRASRWNAVLLLDEADVLLEQRSSKISIEMLSSACSCGPWNTIKG